MTQKLLSEIVFWIHLPIVLLWFGLFLVPASVWSGRIAFHFWFIVTILVLQFLWSVVVFRRVDIICPLTTLLQYLRGYPQKDKRNYGHSFIAELLKRLHLKMSFKAVNLLLLGTLVLIIIEYVWLRS
ncbi:TPA: DUF2784 family protein [Candidatus Woesearchaeota archaeon]|nr:DUF2784 family protein [Candidatus Woesearchaeota archaeon]